MLCLDPSDMLWWLQHMRVCILVFALMSDHKSTHAFAHKSAINNYLPHNITARGNVFSLMCLFSNIRLIKVIFLHFHHVFHNHISILQLQSELDFQFHRHLNIWFRFWNWKYTPLKIQSSAKVKNAISRIGIFPISIPILESELHSFDKVGRCESSILPLLGHNLCMGGGGGDCLVLEKIVHTKIFPPRALKFRTQILPPSKAVP